MAHPLLSIGCFVPILLGVFAIFAGHTVDEGFVGVYWRGGRILDTVSEPGLHFKIPFFTRMEQVQVTLQTDSVRDIPCGTSGGSMLTFDKIEVVNQLEKGHVLSTVKKFGPTYDDLFIFSRIHSELNQFCSSHTLTEIFIDLFDSLDEALVDALQKDCDAYDTGILIESIRVTKPTIPNTARVNFEKLEEQRASRRVAAVKQEIGRKEEELERTRALIRAEANATVMKIFAESQSNLSRISSDIAFLHQKQRHEISTIEHSIFLQKQTAVADAEYYKLLKEAEAQKRLLSTGFLKKKMYEELKSVKKEYLSEDLSSIVRDFEKAGEILAAFDEEETLLRTTSNTPEQTVPIAKSGEERVV